MPVSLAVCETANVVNAALRESLGSSCVVAATAASRSGSGGVGGGGSLLGSSSGDEANTAGNDSATDNLQSQIVANAKRVLMSKIEYEEVENYHDSVLAKLKSKYIIIKPDNNGTNGGPSPSNCNFGNNNKMNGNSAGKLGASNGHGK